MFMDYFLFEKHSKAHISEGVLDYLLKIYLDIENLLHKILKMQVEFELKHKQVKKY